MTRDDSSTGISGAGVPNETGSDGDVREPEAKVRRVGDHEVGASARLLIEWRRAGECTTEALEQGLSRSVAQGLLLQISGTLDGSRRLKETAAGALARLEDWPASKDAAAVWADIAALWLLWASWLHAPLCIATVNSEEGSAGGLFGGVIAGVAGETGAGEHAVGTSAGASGTEAEEEDGRHGFVAGAPSISEPARVEMPAPQSASEAVSGLPMDAELQDLLVRSLHVVCATLKAVSDTLLPTEAPFGSLLDAGVPLDVILRGAGMSESFPQSARSALAMLLQIPAQQSAVALGVQAGGCGEDLHTTWLNSARAAVAGSHCNGEPLLGGLMEVLRVLARCCRRVLWPEILLECHPARYNTDAQVSAVREAALEVASDQRFAFLQPEWETPWASLAPNTVQQDSTGPGAVVQCTTLPARRISRKLRALRLLRSMGRESIRGGPLAASARWLCQKLLRRLDADGQHCNFGDDAWGLLLPVALDVAAEENTAVTSGDAQDLQHFLAAAVRGTAVVLQQATASGLPPPVPAPLCAEGLRALLAMRTTCPAEFQLLVSQLVASQSPHAPLVAELHDALLDELRGALCEPNDACSALAAAALVEQIGPLLRCLAGAVGSRRLASVLISALNEHAERLKCLGSVETSGFANEVLESKRCAPVLAALGLLAQLAKTESKPAPLEPQSQAAPHGRLLVPLPRLLGNGGRWPWRGVVVNSMESMPGEEPVRPDFSAATATLEMFSEALGSRVAAAGSGSSRSEAAEDQHVVRLVAPPEASSSLSIVPAMPPLATLNVDSLFAEAERITEGPSTTAAATIACPPAAEQSRSTAIQSLAAGQASEAVVPPTPMVQLAPPPPGQPPPPLGEEGSAGRRMSGSLLFKALMGNRPPPPPPGPPKPLPGTAQQSAMCTYVKTGSHFVEQHWYYCYTCSFSNEKGICAVCAQTCHAGHQVVYSRRSRFFCDCGASGCCGAVQRSVQHCAMKDYTSWAAAQPQGPRRPDDGQELGGVGGDASALHDWFANAPLDSRTSGGKSRRSGEGFVLPIPSASGTSSSTSSATGSGSGSTSSAPVAAVQPSVEPVRGSPEWGGDALSSLLGLVGPITTLLRQSQQFELTADVIHCLDPGEIDPSTLEVLPWASFPKGSFECQLRGDWSIGGVRQLGRSAAKVHAVARRPVAFVSRNQLVITEKDRVRLVELKDDALSPTGGGSPGGGATASSAPASAEGEEAPAKRRRVFDDGPKASAPVLESSSGERGDELTQRASSFSQKPGEVTKLESCRFPTPFEPLGVATSEAFPGLFAISSFEECHVCVPGRGDAGKTGQPALGAGPSDAVAIPSSTPPTGTMSRMALDLMLEAHGEAIVVLRVCWLPQSKTELAIITNQFVKIYDLAVDRICPSRYVQVLQGVIADAAFEIRKSPVAESSPVGGPSIGLQGVRASYRLWVLSASPPALFYQDLGGPTGDGPAMLQHHVALPLPPSSSGASPRAGLALLFSHRLNALLAAFDDGLLVLGTPSTDTDSLAKVRVMHGGLPPRERAVAYSQLFEWERAPGMIFVGCSRKHNAVHLISFACPRTASSNSGAMVTPISMPPGNPRGTFEGVALLSLGPHLARLAVLMEDGSLHLYTLRRGPNALGTSGSLTGLLAWEQLATVHQSPPARALEPISLPASSSSSPLEFPRDFFEHALNFTADPALAKEVSFAGDALRQLSADTLRQRLSPQNDEVLYCEVPEDGSEFSLEVHLASRRRWAIAGVRFLLGHVQRGAAASGVAGSGVAVGVPVGGPGPVSAKFVEGQRRVQFWTPETMPVSPSGRRWFDVPLSPSESLACTAKATFTFPTTAPFTIDAVEVYVVPLTSLPCRIQVAQPDAANRREMPKDSSGGLLLCPAASLVREWLGTSAPAPPPTGIAIAGADPSAVARSIAASAFGCIAALPSASAVAGWPATAPPALRMAASLWQDPMVAAEAGAAMGAVIGGGAADLASTQLLLAADTFLSHCALVSCGDALPMSLVALAAEWCRQVASCNKAGASSSSACRHLLLQRPNFAEAIGVAVRGALMQPRNLLLCPASVLNTLATAAMTAALLHLQMKLQKCFWGASGASGEMPPDDAETMWRSLCDAAENMPHFDTITCLLTVPSFAVQDCALRALLSFVDAVGEHRDSAWTVACGAQAAPSAEPEAATNAAAAPLYSAPSGQEGKEPASDGSDIDEQDEEDEADIPMADGANRPASVVAPGATASSTDVLRIAAGAMAETSAAAPNAPSPETADATDLLPLLLLTHLSSVSELTQARWSSVRKGALADTACFFEAAQRLVLICLESSQSSPCLHGRYASIYRLVFAERALSLSQVILQTVPRRFPPIKHPSTGHAISLTTDGSEVAEGDADAAMGADDATEGDAAKSCADDCSKGFLCACFGLLGALVTTLLRCHEGNSATQSVATAVLGDFAPSATSLVLPLFSLLRRNSGILAKEGETGDSFLATGGIPPSHSEYGLLKAPVEVPPSHLDSLLPASWAGACEAEACHTLDRPTELLTTSALALLMVLLKVPHVSHRLAPSGKQGVSPLLAFATALGSEEECNQSPSYTPKSPQLQVDEAQKTSESSTSAAASAAEVCAEVLTQLAMACGGLGDSEKSQPTPVAAAVAAGARSLLCEMCRSQRTYHRLLDFALFARVRDDLRPHVDRRSSASAEHAVSHCQASVYIDGCRTLWGAAKQRPWTWVQFIESNPQLLEYCFSIGHALGFKYGCASLRFQEVIEDVALPFRLISLALAAPIPRGALGRLSVLQWAPADIFRTTVETALCSGARELRHNAAVALALAWDDLKRADGGCPAVCEVRGVMSRAIDTLLLPLGSRSLELAGVAAHVLCSSSAAASNNAVEVIGRLARHLCCLQLRCAVPLKEGRATFSVDAIGSSAHSVRSAMLETSVDGPALRDPGEASAAAASAVAAVSAPSSSRVALPGTSDGDSLTKAAVPQVTAAEPEKTHSPATSSTSSTAQPRSAILRGQNCGICAELSLPLSRARLESLRAEMKYSDEKMWVRFPEAIAVSAVGIVMHEHILRQGGCGRHIGHVKVYFNDANVHDVATLKAQSHAQNWQPLCQLFFEPTREGFLGSAKSAPTEVTAKLLAPVTCCSLLFEYAEWGGGVFGCPGLDGGRMLVCPRCHRPAGKAGICLQCGDNAFQCPKCRNINYEKLDALFCNDCGYCRFVKMETWLTCRVTQERHVGGLRSEAECRQASETLEGIVRQLRAPVDIVRSPATPTVDVSAGNPAASAGGVPAVAEVSLPSSAGGGGSSASGAIGWRPASAPPRSETPGERPLLSPARRAASSSGNAGVVIGASTPEENQFRLQCSAQDVRQKILRCRRSQPYPGTREGRTVPQGALFRTLSSGDTSSWLCASCEECVLAVLICTLQLLGRVLEVVIDEGDGRRAVQALRAAAPQGFMLLQDCLLPLALRCAATDARTAARRVLHALVARCTWMDRALCAELGRHLQWTCLGASPMVLRATAQQAKEETRLMLELVVASRRPAQWVCRLPLLARTLGDVASASQPLLASEVTLPSLLLALHIAQNLARGASVEGVAAASRSVQPMQQSETLGQQHDQHAASSPSSSASLSQSWHAHLYGLLFPDFVGPCRGKAGGELRRSTVAARVLARWHSRLNAGVRQPVGACSGRIDVWSRSWPLEALTRASSPKVRYLVREILTVLLAAKPAGGMCQGTQLRVLDCLRTSVLASGAPKPTSEAALQLAHSLLCDQGSWARRMYCVATGWLPLLRQLISDECVALVDTGGAEEDYGAQGAAPPLWSEMSIFPAWLNAGHSCLFQAEALVWALRILHIMLAEPMLACRRRREGLEFAECVLTSLLLVRSLQHSHLLHSSQLLEASSLLEKALQLLQGEAPAAPVGRAQTLAASTPHPMGGEVCRNNVFVAERRFLEACIRTLRNQSLARKLRILGLQMTVATKFTFDQIAALLCPEQREKPVLLHIQKAASQEEYIRGQMRKNPYVSTEIGPTMRHVREKICSDLNIRDAMEIMEMLVGDKIIGLDLPIGQVNEQVWVPFVIARRERLAEQAAAERGAAAIATSTDRQEVDAQQQTSWEIPPMTVVFRLAGVDGEATEDRIDSLADNASEAEIALAARRRGLCGAFADIGGVTVIVETLSAAIAERRQEGTLELVDVVLRITHACTEAGADLRRQLVDRGGMRALLAHLLRSIDDMCACKAADLMGPLETRVAERLLSMVESLARQSGALLQECLQPLRAETGEYSAKDHVSLLLSLLCQTEASKDASASDGGGGQRAPAFQKMRTQVASLLPFLTFGQPAPVEVLVRACMPLPLPAPQARSSAEGKSATPEATDADSTAEGARAGAQEERRNAQHARVALSLDLVTAAVEHVPTDSAVGSSPGIGEAIRGAFLRAGAVQSLLQYLEDVLPSSSCDKTSPEWVEACQAPGLSSALRILAGLAVGFNESQRLVASHASGRLLRLLLLLEGTAVSSMQTGGNSSSSSAAAGAEGTQCIGAYAEGLLEALKKGNEDVKSEIDSLRRSQRSKKTNRSSLARQKMLKALGMAAPAVSESDPSASPSHPAAASTPAPASAPAPEQTVAPAPAATVASTGTETTTAAGNASTSSAATSGRAPRTLGPPASNVGVEELLNFQDIEEDLRCCVCQEGYHFQPDEVLCVYTFVKPVVASAAQITPESAGDAVQYKVSPRFSLCTVSHFTVIHWHCHQSATKAAANLRPKPQGEWESATVRNSSSRCNSLIPVFGPSVSDTTAAQALDRHFSHLGQIAKGNAQAVLGQRVTCVLNDLRLCFSRLACQESFSVDTGGGGPRHNMNLVMVKLQLLCHDMLNGELADELGKLERACVEPLLDFRDPHDAVQALARYRISGQPDGPHPGHLWAHCAFVALLQCGTPGGGASVEWSAGTLWRLLVLALEITRKHGSMRWDQRKGGVSSPSVKPASSVVGGGSPVAANSPRRQSLGFASPGDVKLPTLTLEASAIGQDLAEDGPEDEEAEFSLLSDAVPMLRFLLLCDLWRCRLERWSQSDGGDEFDGSSSPPADSGATGSDCIVVARVVQDGGFLGTPLLERPPLRQRLRRFDCGLLEVGEAIAHLMSSLTSPTVLWRFFLYRLGDPGTPEFAPKLPRHAGAGADPLELLRPPRLKADPSLAEVAMLPRLVLKGSTRQSPAIATSPSLVHGA